MVCGEERREPLHLGRNYYPAQQLPTNRNVAGPWALLVNVSALLRFQRCLEAETNRLEEADRTPYQLNPKTLRNLLDDTAKLENIIKYNHDMESFELEKAASPGRLNLRASTQAILLVQEYGGLLHEGPLILRVSIRWVTGFPLRHC